MARCDLFLVFWIVALQVLFYSSDSSSFPVNEGQSVHVLKSKLESLISLMSHQILKLDYVILLV